MFLSFSAESTTFSVVVFEFLSLHMKYGNNIGCMLSSANHLDISTDRSENSENFTNMFECCIFLFSSLVG